MKRRVPFLVLVGLVSSAVVLGQEPAAPAGKPKGLAGAGLTRAQVDQAIEKAKGWLLQKLEPPKKPAKPGAAEPPPAALSDDQLLTLLALSHTDAFARDRALGERELARLYATKLGTTYPTAVAIMALERLGGPRHKPLLSEAVSELVGAMGHEAGVGWRYGRHQKDASRSLPAPAADAPDTVIEVLGGVPIYPPSLGKVEGDGNAKVAGDGSCTQFALLGLHSAAALGLEPPAAVWEQGVEYFARSQREDGGWSYMQRDAKKPTYGSMTCAGIAGLSIGLSHRGVARPQDDERVKKGLAWLAARWTLDENPGAADGEKRWHFYYLYGLERVGALLGTELIGDHEWYPEGARYLLATQSADGSWKSKHGGHQLHDTCFALLFLTRATTPLYGPQGGTGTLVTAYTPPAAPRTGLLFVLDASDSMNEKIKDRTKWAVVRDAAKKLVAKLPDGALVGLRVYGHNAPHPMKVDENETELLIPVLRLRRDWFDQTVDAIVPKGRTPIAMSLDRCAIDLANAPPCRVLLLSDGAETGGGDPVASARALAANPKCLAIDCLAFDLAKDEKERGQLKEVARVGRGRYVETEDPEVIAELGAPPTVDWTLADDAGKEVAKGKAGERRALPEGHYRIRTIVNDEAHERGLWVNTGRETWARFHPDRAKKR